MKSPVHQKKYYYTSHSFIFYEIRGNGTIPVIFIHGFASSHLNWYSLTELFPSNQYTFYIIDLKGFGLSSKPKDNHYELDDQASLILKIIEKEGLQRIILAGHSLGGGVALALYNKMATTERITKMILIDSAAFNDHLPLFVKLLKLPVLGSLLMNLLPSNKKVVKWAIQRVYADKSKVSEEIVERYLPFYYKKAFRYVYLKTVKGLPPANYEEMIKKYSEIKIPLLIIWGDSDPVLPVLHGKRLHQLIPCSKLSVIPCCGHVPQEEKALETYQEITNFLEAENISEI